MFHKHFFNCVFLFSFLEQCAYGKWFNTDTNPGDRGDMEYIEDVVKVAQNIRAKSCRYPEKIAVRKQGALEEKEFTERSTTSETMDNQQVSGDTIAGFSCRNADQFGDITCSDYEIKLCCPGKFFKIFFTNYRMIKYHL